MHQPGGVLAKPNPERRASAQPNADSSSRQELPRRLRRQSPKPAAALLDRTRNRLPVIRYCCRVLPIDAVEPTPFQRDLSDAHHKRLADVINKTGRFLDPIIAVVAPKGGFWTPNGRHRLEAMRRLGAKSITALVVADREVAWQILALNTEKAHNLKERSLEVIRIYRGLVDEDATRPESQFAFYLDEPPWSLLVSAMNASRASAVALTIQSCGDWRPLPMNRCAPPSRITRNGPRWCSTLRRRLRQR